MFLCWTGNNDCGENTDRTEGNAEGSDKGGAEGKTVPSEQHRVEHCFVIPLANLPNLW